MPAAILSIGSELARGDVVNTNGAWLAAELGERGWEVFEHVVVDDEHARIVQALRRLASGADAVVVTGGLGPTSDDRTTAAVAEAAGVSLRRDPASLECIRKHWDRRGQSMPESNVKQADIPDGAEVLANAIGTAPGYALQLGQARVFVLPGVPAEMQRMFLSEAAPLLGEPRDRPAAFVVRLRTWGMPESEIAQRIEGAVSPEVTLGYRARVPEVEIRVAAHARDAGTAAPIARAAAEHIRERLAGAVYGQDDDTYPAVVGDALRQRGLTLAVAESCTGGLVGTMLTDVPGSSDYLLLDAVTYANHAKTTVLGVPPEVLRAHGAVSQQTAVAMAEGARRVADADLAVSITGIAGPTGGTEDKPIGTVWLALSSRSRPVVTQRHRFHGDRERIRILAAYQGLYMVLEAAKT